MISRDTVMLTAAGVLGLLMVYWLPWVTTQLQSNLLLQSILGGTIITALASMKSVACDFVLSLICTKVVLTDQKAPVTVANLRKLVAGKPGAVTPSVLVEDVFRENGTDGDATEPFWRPPSETATATEPKSTVPVTGTRGATRVLSELPTMVIRGGRVMFVSNCPEQNSLTVYMVGRADPAQVVTILDAAVGPLERPARVDETASLACAVFGVASTNDNGGKQTLTWQQMQDQMATRAVDSLILAPGVLEDILRQCEGFLLGETRYKAQGRPWRMGVLVHGPPGTGKSSLASVLCTALGLPLYIVTLSEKTMNDTQLLKLLNSTHQPSVILLEDVDCAGASVRSRAGAARQGTNIFGVANNGHGAGDGAARGDAAGPTVGAVDYTAIAHAMRAAEASSASAAGVTLSGMLNALDGVAAATGRILLMTTNHRDRLDSALTRPGRCDMVVELPGAVRPQISRMFRRRFPDATPVEEAAFVDSVPEGVVPAAGVMTHLLLANTATDASDAAAVKKMIREGYVQTGVLQHVCKEPEEIKTLYWELWARGIEWCLGLYLHDGDLDSGECDGIPAAMFWHYAYQEYVPIGDDRNKLRTYFMSSFPACDRDTCTRFVEMVAAFRAAMPPDFPPLYASRVRRCLENSETPEEALEWTATYLLAYARPTNAHRYDGGPPLEVFLQMTGEDTPEARKTLSDAGICRWQDMYDRMCGEDWYQFAKTLAPGLKQAMYKFKNGTTFVLTRRKIVNDLRATFGDTVTVPEAWAAARRICARTGVHNAHVTTVNMTRAINTSDTMEEVVDKLTTLNEALATALADAAAVRYLPTKVRGGEDSDSGF